MRGEDGQLSAMFSYIPLGKRVPQDHPLRPMRELTDRVLGRLSRRFSRLYSDVGRPSIAPEKLLRALLVQMFYTIRSERMLVEQLQYNLLFRWFVGLGMRLRGGAARGDPCRPRSTDRATGRSP